MVNMKDNYEFSECCLEIDTREKSQSRIKRITDYWLSKGGMTTKTTLPLGDYLITGYFRGKEIDLLIEYKSLIDLSGSYQDLPDKLFRAGKKHQSIALFIEEGNIALSFNNGTFIKNPALRDGSADVLNYYAYKNMLDSFAQDNIHIRCFQHELYFEEDLYSLLIHLSKDCHTGLHVKGRDFNTIMMNVLCKMDGIGAVRAHKLMAIVPNLERLVELAHYEGVFEKLIGTINGKKLRAFIQEKSRINECMKNYREAFVNTPGLTIPIVKVDSIKDSVESPESLNFQFSCKKSCHQGTDNYSLTTLSVPDDSGVEPKSKDDSALPSLLPDNPSLGGGDQQGVIISPADLTGRKPPFLKISHHGVKSPAAPTNDVVHSLEDVITDFCFEFPKSDIEIITMCQYKGFKISEIHKALVALSGTETKLKRFRQGDKTMFGYYGFDGVRAMPEMDIGV